MDENPGFERKLDFSTLGDVVSALDDFFFRESSQGFPAIDKVDGESKYILWGYGMYDRFFDDIPVCIGMLIYDDKKETAVLNMGYVSGIAPPYSPSTPIPKDKEASLQIFDSDYYFDEIKSITDKYAKQESAVISIAPKSFQEVS